MTEFSAPTLVDRQAQDDDKSVDSVASDEDEDDASRRLSLGETASHAVMASRESRRYDTTSDSEGSFDLVSSILPYSRFSGYLQFI